VRRNAGALPARFRALRCHDRQALEQFCLHIARSGPADQRTQREAAGQVASDLKTPSRNGITHPVMSPMVLMKLPIE
jgi:hypothetical protein